MTYNFTNLCFNNLQTNTIRLSRNIKEYMGNAGF